MSINNNASELAADVKYELAINKLDKELKKEKVNTEELFELLWVVCKIAARISGNELKDYSKHLSKELAKSIEMQRGTYGSRTVQGTKYTAAAIQLGAAACGIVGFTQGNAGLSGMAMPVSYAGQGIGSIGQTGEESQNVDRIKHNHDSDEAKRRRDETTSLKGRFSQETESMDQQYDRIRESLNRAKLSIFAG